MESFFLKQLDKFFRACYNKDNIFGGEKMAKKRILLIVAALLLSVFSVLAWIGVSAEYIKYHIANSTSVQLSRPMIGGNFFKYGIETWKYIFENYRIHEAASGGFVERSVFQFLFMQTRVSALGDWWWIMCNVGRVLAIGLLFVAFIVKAIWAKMPKFLFAIPFAFLLLWDFLFSVEAFFSYIEFAKRSTDYMFALSCEWSIASLFTFADIFVIVLLFLNKKLGKVKLLGKIAFAIPFVLVGLAVLTYITVMGTWIIGRRETTLIFSEMQAIAYICAFLAHLIIGFVLLKEPVEQPVQENTTVEAVA